MIIWCIDLEMSFKVTFCGFVLLKRSKSATLRKVSMGGCSKMFSETDSEPEENDFKINLLSTILDDPN